MEEIPESEGEFSTEAALETGLVEAVEVVAPIEQDDAYGVTA
jgi:hypothetical protein